MTDTMSVTYYHKYNSNAFCYVIFQFPLHKVVCCFFLHISVCATSVVIRVRKKTYMWLYIFSIHSFTCLILSSHGARRRAVSRLRSTSGW